MIYISLYSRVIIMMMILQMTLLFIECNDILSFSFFPIIFIIIDYHCYNYYYYSDVSLLSSMYFYFFSTDAQEWTTPYENNHGIGYQGLSVVYFLSNFFFVDVFSRVFSLLVKCHVGLARARSNQEQHSSDKNEKKRTVVRHSIAIIMIF